MRILQARLLLHSRQNSLYGKGNVFFGLDSHYEEYDGMLMRSMLYARFGLHEIAFEAKLRFSDKEEAVFSVHGYPELASELGGIPSLEKLVQNRLARTGELAAIASKPSNLEITIPMRASNSRSKLCISGRTIRREWCQSLLDEWLLSKKEFQLAHSRAAILLNPDDTWTLSRRISEVDTDLSGEIPPQVYRWKEISQSKLSSYADLDESNLNFIFQAAGITLQQDSYRIAKIREDLGQNGSCLLLRFDHLIPDPQAEFPTGSKEQAARNPKWMNAGFIRVEGDFQEYLIDAGNQKVISEFRKWR